MIEGGREEAGRLRGPATYDIYTSAAAAPCARYSEGRGVPWRTRAEEPTTPISNGLPPTRQACVQRMKLQYCSAVDSTCATARASFSGMRLRASHVWTRTACLVVISNLSDVRRIEPLRC